jgi:transposase
MWCVPVLNEEYILRMEDILEVYERPLSYKEPVVCMDEKPIQLLKNISPTSRIPVPNRIGRKDYEYKRKGTASAFCAIEPLKGRHLVSVSKTRKSRDFALFLREIGRSYPNAKKIHLVMDNLNTHREKSLICHLGPKRGAKLWSRFEIHYTPKHASWLNQAETQISMYSRECLGKDRIASIATLKKRSTAWARSATQDRRTINWKFTRAKARKTFDYYMTQ